MGNDNILNQIDQKRLELHRLIHQKEDLLNPLVLQTSQQLDRLILLAYSKDMDSKVNWEE